jgi:hypothetical protein
MEVTHEWSLKLKFSKPNSNLFEWSLKLKFSREVINTHGLVE